jgi:hypothetical protein
MADIELHEGQTEIFEDLFVLKEITYAVAACSRGWGKSYFAATAAVAAVFELLELDADVPNKNVYIIAPTYAQVTDIYHPLLAYQLGMEDHCIRHSKDMGRFWFPKGVELRLVSYEAAERLRGTGAYFIVCDEVRDWIKGQGLKNTWEGILQPLLTTRWSRMNAERLGAPSHGRALIISTTKGYDFFYDMYNFGKEDPEWRSYHFDYTTSPYLDPRDIEKARLSIDPLTFNREYKAVFEDSGNNVFYCFKRDLHVTSELAPLQPWEDVHVCVDFNVGLQCTSMFVIRGSQMHFLDELKGAPDTENLAIAIVARYRTTTKTPKRKIYVYPDPTGNSRKTSAPVGVTDFTILRSYKLTVLARSSSPSIVDSVNAVNRKLMTASGMISIFLHPRCKGTILSLERTGWVDNNADTATIDKTKGVEHFSDGVRYATEYLYPIASHTKRVSTGKNF